MLASRNGRSRLGWFVGLAAFAFALRMCCMGGGGSGAADAPSAPRAATASDPAAGERDGAFATAFARARTGSLAALAIVPGPLRLEGIARDHDQQPIGGARVTLGLGARTATAEADGTFYFEGLAAGDYALTAERGDLYGEDLAFSLSAESDPAELELRRGPTIEVRVADATGAPIAGARVASRDRATTTDAGGHATLRAVLIGREGVTATAEGYAPTGDWFEVGDDPSVTVQRTLVLARGSPVTGVVLDEAGAPVDHAIVSLTDSTKDRYEGLFTDEHGVWTLADLATATYVVSASSTSHISVAEVTFAHDGTHAQSGIVIRVEHGGQITGIVVDTAGAPVSEAHVTAGTQTSDSDSHGRFTVSGLGSDTFDVVAYTQTAGSPNQQVTLARGGHAEVRLVVQPSGIAGVVVDAHGAPIPDVRVHASSKIPSGTGFDTTDEHGHFDVGGLPPGDYDLVATRDGEQDRGDAVPIHVASGNHHVRIVLPELAAIRGRVVLDGKPVPYFGYLLVDDPKDVHLETPTPVRDPDGAFHAGGLRAGTRALVIVGPGFVKHTVEGVELRSGETADLGDIAVERGATLRGHVTDASGAAVAGAVVSVREHYSRAGDAVLDGLLGDAYEARTNARGEYEIAGMTPAAPDARRIIDATTPRGRSIERDLEPGATEADLVISALGVLDGTLRTTDDKIFLIATPLGAEARATYATPDPATGAFAFDPLPVGVYMLSVNGVGAMASRRVEIRADQHTTVAYAPITQLATVRVHWPGCGFLRLLSPTDTDETLGGEVCADDVAAIPGVVPGAYRLCDGDDCKTIDVPTAPEVAIEGPG